jgi:hypothetical protein
VQQNPDHRTKTVTNISPIKKTIIPETEALAKQQMTSLPSPYPIF